MVVNVKELVRSTRNKNLKKQIVLSFLIKTVGVVLNFLIIPITLKYLGKEKYGIWITLLSIISWISLFDIGIGNGLRNKLTEALANGNQVLARKYITTSYVLISLIGLLLLLFLLFANQFINWNFIFNSYVLSHPEFKVLLAIFFSSIIISFILSLINPIFHACQLASLTNISSLFSNGLFICSLLYFKKYIQNSLLSLSTLFCVSLILGNLIVTIFFFLKNKGLRPTLKYFEYKERKHILKLGGSFFIIQIAVLLIFTVDNFLISQLLGPNYVTSYNIVFKLYSIFTLVYAMIMAPMWSAFTEAHVKLDYEWVSNTIRRLQFSMIYVLIGLIILFFLSQPILNFWLPDQQKVYPSKGLLLVMSFFIIISIWNNIYSYYLNGIGETKIQVITALIGATINIPLAVFFVKDMKMELSGIVLSMCISLSIFSIIGPILTFKKVSFYKNIRST